MPRCDAPVEDYIACYLSGNEGKAECVTCRYGFKAEGTEGVMVAVCRPRMLLRDAMTEPQKIVRPG